MDTLEPKVKTMDKNAAARFFMSCSELDLPSENNDSYEAANVLRGHKVYKFQKDKSGIPAVEKVRVPESKYTLHQRCP